MTRMMKLFRAPLIVALLLLGACSDGDPAGDAGEGGGSENIQSETTRPGGDDGSGNDDEGSETTVSTAPEEE